MKPLKIPVLVLALTFLLSACAVYQSGQTPPDKPEGDRFGGQGGSWFGGQEQTPEFEICDGGNMFSGISAK